MQVSQLQNLSDTEIRMQLAVGAFSADDLWQLLAAFRGTPREYSNIFWEISRAYVGIQLEGI